MWRWSELRSGLRSSLSAPLKMSSRCSESLALVEGFRKIFNMLRELYENSFEHEMNVVYDDFIDNPGYFYREVVGRAKERELKDFEPALFTAPCCIRGEPMRFTHRDDNWI